MERANTFNAELNSKQEYDRIEDIQIEQIPFGDPEYDHALQAYNYGSELSLEQIEKQVKDKIVGESWWLLKYWQEKGLPHEQLVVNVENKELQIFNYGALLNEAQIKTIREVITKLAQINNGQILRDNRYILIDNNEKVDGKSGNPRNGVTLGSMKAIQLYPNALKPIEHRVKGVSNLEGTLIHEYGHVLHSVDFQNKWLKENSWKMVSEEEMKMIDDHTHLWVNEEPEKLPTDYARFNHKEDICESLVVALKNPSALDPTRLEMLQSEWLRDIDQNITLESTVVRKEGNQIELPKIKQPVKYKVKHTPGIKVVNGTKKEPLVKLGQPKTEDQG